LRFRILSVGRSGSVGSRETPSGSSVWPRRAGNLIVTLAAAGNRAEADEIFRRMEAPNQRPRWGPSIRAYALAALGRHDEALVALEEAVRIRDGSFAEFLYHHLFVPLHQEPRFMRTVKELEMERRIERLRQRLKISG
jgi:tetratricopeptide (TPR) repeat protein